MVCGPPARTVPLPYEESGTHTAGWLSPWPASLAATRAGGAAVFVNYSRSPEARYPVAIEECYAALEWIAAHGGEHGLDPERIAVAGDSVGGNMSAAVTLMAKQRSGPTLARLRHPMLARPNRLFPRLNSRRFASGSRSTRAPSDRKEPDRAGGGVAWGRIGG